MQKDNKFTAFWIDTTTAPGTPLVGLSATITIRLATSPYTTLVDNEAMTDIGGGDYIYIFEGYDSKKDYIYKMNPNSSLAFIQNGQTDSRLDYLDKPLTDIVSGGFIRNTGLDMEDKKRLKETHEKVMKLENTDVKNIEKTITEIEENLNDIDSHIELAKIETIDTIKTTENEICSDVIRKSKDLEESNVKTRNLVRQKTKKIDENVSKLADRQDLTDKMIEHEADEIESEIEGLLNEEADMIEDEIYNMEADEIEKDITNQSNDGNSESNS